MKLHKSVFISALLITGMTIHSTTTYGQGKRQPGKSNTKETTVAFEKLSVIVTNLQSTIQKAYISQKRASYKAGSQTSEFFLDRFEMSMASNKGEKVNHIFLYSAMYLYYTPSVKQDKSNLDANQRWYVILEGVRFAWADKSTAQTFVDGLHSLKYEHYIDDRNEQELIKFKVVSDKYKSLSIKPSLTEVQRKYIIQAELMREEKKYDDAINLFEKAIAVDPSYPDAHVNRAGSLAVMERYGEAIVEAKKYLMLEPNGSLARAAQDNIYEWEAKLGEKETLQQKEIDSKKQEQISIQNAEAKKLGTVIGVGIVAIVIIGVLMAVSLSQ